MPPRSTEITEGFSLYTIRTERRSELIDYLTRKGINAGIYYPLSIHLQKAFRFLGYGPGDFPESEKAQEEVLSLPFDIYTTREQVDKVCSTIHQFFTN